MADRFREGLRRTPFGTPMYLSTRDPGGMGDRSAGGVIFVPSKDLASVPHESMHAGIQQLTGPIPGSTLAEALLSRLSDYAYGGESQYRNPLERIAYGYQEAITGEPDIGYQESGSPEKVSQMPGGKGEMLVRSLLEMLGAGTEKLGRRMGSH